MPNLVAETCPPLSVFDRLKVDAAKMAAYSSLDDAARRLALSFPGWRVERPRGDGSLHLFDPLGWKRMTVRENTS